MASTFRLSTLRGLLLSAVLLRNATASLIPMAYCAKINTASTDGNYSIWQSDGACQLFCINDFAYAIVRDNDCWCSDYTPTKSEQVAVSECDTPCPGYTSDVCGGTGGLFGYISLDKNPSGTAGSGSSSSSSSSSSNPDTTSPTVHTVTAGGVVETVTVTPSSGSSSADGSSLKSQHKGISTGAAVGIAIGVVAIVVLAAAATFFVWRRRRQHQEPEDALFTANNPNTPSPRGSSPNASHSPQVAEASVGPSFARRNGEGNWESDQSGRRRSTLMPIDPRIDPAFSDIYTRPDNKSRDSVNSLRDDHDYSRRVLQPTKVLRATNPDPDDE